MGTGSNGQGSGGGDGGKGEIRRETSHLGLALRTLQRARSASASTLRFIDKGFDVTPSHVAGSQPVWRKQAKSHHDAHAPASSCTRKAWNGGAWTRDNQTPWITTPALGARRREHTDVSIGY